MPVINAKKKITEALFRRFSESFLNVIFLPKRLFIGMLTKDFRKFGEELISLSPHINSVNDHTCFHEKRFSFDKYGYWGYYPGSSLGTNFGAMYAFLPNYFVWKIGICGYSLFSLICYLALIFTLAITSPSIKGWMVFPVGFMALNSPYFKNSAFVAGRYDVPGWALLMGGLWLLLLGEWLGAFITLTLAFMTHPSISIVGSLYFLCLVLLTYIPTTPAVLVFLGGHCVNLFWYIPFYKTIVGRKTTNNESSCKQDKAGVKPGQWSLSVKDQTRTWKIHFMKGLGMLIFVVPVSISNHDMIPILLTGVPFFLFLVSTRKEFMVNRFSLELVWLCSSLTAFAWNPSFFLGVMYLFSLFLYASPAPRFSFPFRPFTVKKEVISTTFSPVLRLLPPYTRIGFLYLSENCDAWRMDAKYSNLFSIGLVRQDRNLEHVSITSPGFGGEISFLEGEKNIRAFERISAQYGISHFLVPAKYESVIADLVCLKNASRCSLPKIGSVPAADFILMEMPGDVLKVLPAGEILEEKEMLFAVRCGSGKHEIKYQAFPGIRAYQDDQELNIDPGGALNFYIRPNRGGEIKFRYDISRLWLPQS